MSEHVIEGEIVHEHALERAEIEARNLPAVRASEAMVTRGEVSVEEIVVQRDKIKQVMEQVMTEGVHYGKIPGIDKPSLYKPGAEVLAVTLRLAPFYESERTFHEGSEHLTVFTKVTLKHIPTGLTIAEGEGLCSTKEDKYAYRGEGRTCPACGSIGTIKKSKFPPREGDYPGASSSDPPGWYCYAKAGGCGRNYAAQDTVITSQTGEKIPNPNLSDSWNTVLKMANKRALIAAILNGTAASDIFTQDIEDSSRSSDSVQASSRATRSQREPDTKQKKLRDIEDLFSACDTKREMAPGTTWGEISGLIKGSLAEMSEEQLDALGKSLGQFTYGPLSKQQMNDAGFAKYYATSDDDIPF